MARRTTGAQRPKEIGAQAGTPLNLTPQMLQANIKSAGLTGIFEEVISTDQARTFKPDPRAYQLGIESLGLQRDQVLFAAFAGWDAAATRLFGYPTFWVNRLKLPAEELGAVRRRLRWELAGLGAIPAHERNFGVKRLFMSKQPAAFLRRLFEAHLHVLDLESVHEVL